MFGLPFSCLVLVVLLEALSGVLQVSLWLEGCFLVVSVGGPFGLGGSVTYLGYFRSEQHGAGSVGALFCVICAAVNGLLLLLLDLVPRFGWASLWC
ncbi:hypothetical protein U1Q18_017495 [Sarracenia purpurea var. burkii]